MRKIAVLLSCLILFSFSGCSTEIYDRLLIKAIGIDKNENGYSISVRAEDFRNEKEYVIKSEGESVFSALSDLSKHSGDTQLYSHIYFLVLGKSMLGENLRNNLDFFYRYYKSQVTAIVYAAEDKAEDIINAENSDGLIPSEDIAKISRKENHSGKIIVSSLLDFIADSERAGGSAVLATLAYTDKELSVNGARLFGDYKYLTDLSSEEAEGMYLALGKAKNAEISAKTEEALVSVQIDSIKCDTQEESENNYRLSINAKLSLSAGAGYEPDGDGYEKINSAVSKSIKKKVSSVLNKSYKNGCDLLKIAYGVYLKDSELWKKSKDDWPEIIKEFNFDVKVKTEIKRIGEENFPYA